MVLGFNRVSLNAIAVSQLKNPIEDKSRTNKSQVFIFPKSRYKIQQYEKFLLPSAR